MKKLNVGDRIRLEGVVVKLNADNSNCPHGIRIGKDSTYAGIGWIGDDELNQCEIIESPQAEPEKWKCADCGAPLNEGEAKTFTCCDKCWDKAFPNAKRAEAQKWEPKVGDRVQFDSGLVDNWIDAEILTISETSMFLTPLEAPNTAYRIAKSNIRPITPKAYDPRQPLFDYMSKEHDLILLQDEMDEIIRICNEVSTPPWVDNTPKPLEVTDEEIHNFFKQYDQGIASTVRHFLNLQRGGRG